MQKFKDCFSFEPKFFILNKQDSCVMAVEKETEHGYEGLNISFGFENERVPQWEFEASPMYIAKTFLSQLLLKYDFTLDQDNAEMHCIQ